MPDDSEQEQDSQEPAVSGGLPWITRIKVFTTYQLSIKALSDLVKAKKVRVRKINNTDHYSVADLDTLPEEGSSDQETSMADLVRASRDLLGQAQSHHEKMFDKLMGGLSQLLKSSADQIDKQNDHILELEKQSLAMREAAEKVFNLEHERKMGELREERTRAMQSKALEMLQKTVAPWVASKLGSMAGGGGPAPATDGADPRFTQLGQAVVNMVITMTDEQFAALGNVLPPEEYSVLTMIRQSAKG